MNNINAFLKLKAYEKHISVNELAKLTNKSQSYISRILNNQIAYSSENRTFKQLCHFLDIKDKDLQLNADSLKKEFYTFLDDACFNNENRDLHYQELTSKQDQFKNSPGIIYIYLTQVIYKGLSIRNITNSVFNPIINKMIHISQSLEIQEQIILSTFYSFYLNKINQYKLAQKYIYKINIENCDNSSIKTMYYFIKFGIEGHLNQSHLDSMMSYSKCKELCIQTNNIKRLLNLEGDYANELMNLGCIDESINLNKDNLKNVIKYLPDNLWIRYNNIAWGYMLKHDYKEALKYYNMIDKDKIDDDILFNKAWCKYQLKDYKQARLFLEEAKNIEVSNPIYPILNNWLIAMMNKKYSLKTYQLLCEIEEEHSEYLSMDMQHFIEIEKLNYYTHNHKEKEALKLTKKIIDSSFISSSVIKL